MTTNKPEVMAWYTPATRYTLPVVALDDRSQRGEPLIRLSDYEALQDKCEHYKAALLEMTVRSVSDQWRRSATDKELDQYLSEGIAQTEEERDRYKAECEALRTCLAETAGVAVTMLYESHKADTLKEFDVTELARMVDYTKHLADANVQVEKVYRKAWGMAHGCDGADWGGSK